MHTNTQIETFYVHGQPFEDEMAPYWPPEDDRQLKIHYLLYENSVDVEIDLDTGETRILAFDDIPLAQPTKWR